MPTLGYPRELRAVARLGLLAGVILLSACRAPAVTPSSSAERWRDAVARGDFGRAQGQIVANQRAQWRQDTEALVKGHGAVRIPVWSGGRSGFPPGFDQRQAIYRLVFADGYERCLRVRSRGSRGSLELVDGGYVDCATVPAPSVRYGTPATPSIPSPTPTP